MNMLQPGYAPRRERIDRGSLPIQGYNRYTELGEQEVEEVESDDDIIDQVSEIADIAENGMFSCDDVFNFINNLPPPTRSAFKSNTNPQTAAFAKPSHTTFIIFLLICLGKRPSLGSNLGF
ncbi:hypothetical protein L5515_019396 [Caenorhabditis briggsae]|uniref:Uncharacterized protein n=1 Tax=Caenorhabditis briggsae TaxID=6238 RepID=A0AAE9JU31_CAEBR|nr:hypothetical protein L5515_019396 [Caenorhabditis briggsae]